MVNWFNRQNARFGGLFFAVSILILLAGITLTLSLYQFTLTVIAPPPFSYDVEAFETKPMCAGDESMSVYVVGYTDNKPNVTEVYGTVHPAQGGPRLCRMPMVTNINIGGPPREFGFWFARDAGNCSELPPGEYEYRHGTVSTEEDGTRLVATVPVSLTVMACEVEP